MHIQRKAEGEYSVTDQEAIEKVHGVMFDYLTGEGDHPTLAELSRLAARSPDLAGCDPGQLERAIRIVDAECREIDRQVDADETNFAAELAARHPEHFTYVDDFDEFAKHFYAIVPDGYFEHREINPHISDVMITGLTLAEAAAIIRHFRHTYVGLERASHPDTPELWDIHIHSIPTETANSFCDGLTGWLEERV
jgi:hypothetical protein